MEPLPTDFLAKIAREYQLTPEQQEAFTARYSSKKSDRDIAEKLYISENALRTRMSGVYQKFSIGGKGPGKTRRLHDFLIEKYRKTAKTAKTTAAPMAEAEPDINALVQELREKIRPYTQERCGTMRVLDMSQPIGLGDIYTNVNILEKILGRRRLALAELWQGADLENFDRFGLSGIAQERVPGLEALRRYAKLMVLGKPGAGKTTFLKYLAVQCIGGEFQAKQVPILITLKEFAENSAKLNLLEFISQTFGNEVLRVSQKPGLLKLINQMLGNDNDAIVEMRPIASIQELLRCGRALILLDGLDEVREKDAPRVIQQVEKLAEQYPHNQFVITCRIAAREYTFEKFTEVEVADFNKKQISTFAANWFKTKNAPEQAERFLQQLEENEQISELATNPLLLTLLCLEFEDGGDFPSDRAELYERATATLLRKWDAKRGIQRDAVYKKLTVQRKEDLLSEVAFTTFKSGDYFFKQKRVKEYIADYIRNLPDAQADPEALLLDSEAVLKSIEAQHGLLVERAASIYSFSHLTFQEYFTARNIVTVSQPQALEVSLQDLAARIVEKRWREVFLLAVGMLRSGDRLLQLMKLQVDGIIAEDEKLQEFLAWVEQKSLAVRDYVPLNFARAFYVCLTGVFDFGFWNLAEVNEIAYFFEIDLLSGFCLIEDYREGAREDALVFDQIMYDLLYLSECSDFSPNNLIHKNVDSIVKIKLPPGLKRSLLKLRDELPDPSQNQGKFRKLWQDIQPLWSARLRAVLVKYCNIGRDWQFSTEEWKLMKQYYDANSLLLQCLNSDCYVSREVREEIENTLLLPRR